MHHSLKYLVACRPTSVPLHAHLDSILSNSWRGPDLSFGQFLPALQYAITPINDVMGLPSSHIALSLPLPYTKGVLVCWCPLDCIHGKPVQQSSLYWSSLNNAALSLFSGCSLFLAALYSMVLLANHRVQKRLKAVPLEVNAIAPLQCTFS